MLDLVPWFLFATLVAGMLALDLGVFHRHAHEVKRREALAWSVVWIGLAAMFNGGIYVVRGTGPGLEWTTGYLLEKSLSIDNIFVFLLLFATFGVPAAYQHRLLLWGVVGAIVMRAVLIVAAGAVLGALHFAMYVFGAFLVVTGFKFLGEQQAAPNLDKNWLVRLARRFFRTTPDYEGQRFFTRRSGVLYATPLFLVLLLVESSDLIFAVDSIPAVYAVTSDPFIVFTSNIFAILGLRSLYFVLHGFLANLVYLKPALAAILVFVGGKMLVADLYEVSALASLVVICGTLAVALVASLLLGVSGKGPVVPEAVTTEGS